jgi:membrane fusion protein (multidrug efflux system)
MKTTRMIVMGIIGMSVVLGALGTVKALQIKRMAESDSSFVPPPQTVTVAEATAADWESSVSAVGSLKAVKGVLVASELAGKITKIAFEPGSRVKSGQLLVRQDTSAETAQLKVAESRAHLALKNLERARELHKQQVIPVAQLDESKAAYDQAAAQVELIRTAIAKKTIRAPFAGRLGIRQVDLGEFLDSGQPIVSLQALDPIYVNFQLPQQRLPLLRSGLSVRVSADAQEGRIVEGKISAVNPEIDSRSRNVLVQATLANDDEQLRPGMFAKVEVLLPERKKAVAIPATAVHYAPYSDSVFVVEPAEEGGDPQRLVLRQQFVELGEKRGDFVAVRQGLQAGQTVVSTGVFKLRNGQAVVVDNQYAPQFETAPRPSDA